MEKESLFVIMTAVNVTKAIIYSFYCSSILSRFVSMLSPFANITLWKLLKKNYVGIHMDVWNHQLKYIQGWNLLYSVNWCFQEVGHFNTICWWFPGVEPPLLYQLMLLRGGPLFTLYLGSAIFWWYPGVESKYLKWSVVYHMSFEI